MLASAVGAERRTLARKLDERGIARRGRRLDTQDSEETIRLYRAGWFLAGIADRFGVYPQSIRYQLEKYDIPLRPRPGWSPPQG
jgi:hypothetical protein